MNALSQNCPYCDVRPLTSNDHIFPDFLGGKITIRSCTKCNNTFGHTFEAAVLSDLAPLMVVLRSSGLPAPRYAVWKKATIHQGMEIDIDTDLKSNVSQTCIEKDEHGAFKSGTFHSAEVANRSLRGLERAGKNARITESTLAPLSLSELTLRVTIGAEIRRLAVKIGIAAADLMGHRAGVLDGKSRAFLLGDKIEGPAPVRLDFSHYEALQKLRPPLSHNVFVKGNGRTGHCYAVVMFYGFIQLYVILNDTGFKGTDFAVFGFLSPVDSKTAFNDVELISLAKPPQFVTPALAEAGMKKCQGSFQEQAKVVFGDGKVSVKMEYLGSQQER